MAHETERAGNFGVHGGQYIPEILMNAVQELEAAYKRYKDDPEFKRELSELLNEYAGRPSRLYYARHMSEDLGGAKIYLKREDLNHTGAHKINNALGQALLAKYMGKKRLIAETGAGQHGVATATVAALLNMECVVYMGEEDTVRQALNVYRMRLLGAEVVPVKSGTRTLKDAVSEAMRAWTMRIEDTHYCLGSSVGPHPFPTIVRDFQAVISEEIKADILKKEGRLPDAVIACVGGGSNAIGSFYHFIDDKEVGDAFEYLSRTEGIIPAIESSHAVAYAKKLAPTMDKNQIIVVTLSGRGDKDVAAIARYRGEDLHE